MSYIAIHPVICNCSFSPSSTYHFTHPFLFFHSLILICYFSLFNLLFSEFPTCSMDRSALLAQLTAVYSLAGSWGQLLSLHTRAPLTPLTMTLLILLPNTCFMSTSGAIYSSFSPQYPPILSCQASL